jgi:hypothetical protein
MEEYARVFPVARAATVEPTAIHLVPFHAAALACANSVFVEYPKCVLP